jgi:hypothetical protein
MPVWSQACRLAAVRVREDLSGIAPAQTPSDLISRRDEGASALHRQRSLTAIPGAAPCVARIADRFYLERFAVVAVFPGSCPVCAVGTAELICAHEHAISNSASYPISRIDPCVPSLYSAWHTILLPDPLFRNFKSTSAGKTGTFLESNSLLLPESSHMLNAGLHHPTLVFRTVGDVMSIRACDRLVVCYHVSNKTNYERTTGPKYQGVAIPKGYGGHFAHAEFWPSRDPAA